jgi:hypothetical protein
MKTLINKINTTKKILLALALVAVLFPVSSALAGDDYGWYDGGSNGDYYFDTYTPSYSYDSYTPSYSYDSYTPSYSYYDTYDSYSGGSYYQPSTGGSYYQPATTGGSSGGYSGYPAYQYVQTPSRPSTGGAASIAPGYQYVYSSNANSNTNTNTNTATANNTNTITNTFNPVNNNDARINLVVLGGGTGTNNGGGNNTSALNGSCTISPSTTYVNQDVTFSATASGGNGGYTYSWTGDNGVYSSSQSFTGRYSYTGVKNATVTIRSSDGQIITRTCSTNVQDTYNPPIVSGAYCVANPTNAGVNQNVTWTVYPGNNVYGSSYNWTGTDGLMGYGQTISRVYNTPGYKSATVTMFANGQTTTVNCGTNIQGNVIQGTPVSNVTVLREQTPITGTPVAGVFLNQVPDTGISFGLKMALFTLGLLMWSIFGAYMFSRKNKLASANGAATGTATLSKIEAFKRANMAKKGIL